ncbi:DUF4349 domain-containing protein [Candidatus Falkowbacteria bacterium]|nr:DUF4349 domain-containing protein [Candidatus Falkowbacteria bacterium]
MNNSPLFPRLWEKFKQLFVIVAVVLVVGSIVVYFGATSLTRLRYGGISANDAPSYGGAFGDYGVATGLSASDSRGVFQTKVAYEADDSGNGLVAAAQAQEGELTQKKIIRNGALGLFVDSPEESAQAIERVALSVDGFVQDSNISEQTNGSKYGEVVIRVPAVEFDSVMEQIKGLAREVEFERENAQDVTEQFVDLDAQLRNYRAEEGRYLKFMNQAKNIDETLKVAERLSVVRGQIERIEGQLKFLSRQVDMSVISVSLTSYDDVKVFGVRWRPLYELKKAARGLFEAGRTYINFVIKLVVYLPIIVLWALTILLVTWVVWKLLKWLHRRFLQGKKLDDSWPRQ